ncbi:Protein pob1 [Lentinula edodes]|uniref:Protein pob1 n=1 Tax=Lentinula edodes TaxID=5353 RepID=A0A1Q3E702_LENED|nr:Protein pob1 [Lentinula edodes]
MTRTAPPSISVYVPHDFSPENDDEVPFRAGERIEVIEKDEAYGDGWWQGRNLAGKTGLFPQSYTAPAPTANGSTTGDDENDVPSNKMPLHPLDEESEPESSPQAPAIFVNRNEADGEVMKATLTDVQQAIEQLKMNRTSSIDGDGARSFSFASTREDRDTDRESETDYELSDTEHQEFGDDGHHKSTRQCLEDAEKLKMMMGGISAGNRTSAPPIEVEMSDESDGEDDEDYTHSSSFFHRHSAIEEVDEDTEGNGTAPTQTPQVHQDLTLPEQEVDESEAQTATAPSFPSLSTNEDATDTKSILLPTPTSPGFAHSESTISTVIPIPISAITPPSIPSTPPRTITPAAAVARSPSPMRETLVALPSPTASSFHSNSGAFHFSPHKSQHNSVPSVPSSALATAPVTTSESSQTNSQPSQKDNEQAKEKEKTHPSEWNVDEVVEWVRGKGFGEDVCAKFTEQEITGDVLLELDVNLLKNEIGIMAFGKRVRIANAIAELRRPPSINYDEQVLENSSSPFAGSQSVHRMMNQSPQLYAQSPHSVDSQPYSHPTHLRNQSQSQSHHSFQGSATSMSGFRDSFGSNGALIAAAGLMSPESAPHTGDLLGSPRSGELFVNSQEKALKSRPAQLTLSPSDSALNTSVTAISQFTETEEDCAAISKGETSAGMTQSARRRLFGRSHDSAASGSKDSRRSSFKDGASPTSAAIVAEGDSKEKGKKEKDTKKGKETDGKDRKDGKNTVSGKSHARARKSIDAGKSGERLSIFGGTFSGMGKGRKPPPRYSAASEDAVPPSLVDKSTSGSSFHLPRFSTGPRKPSTRPGSSSSPKEKEKSSKDLLSPHKEGTIQPVISSVNIPTIPLMVAQAMNPAPRPPSPTARDATQKALRRENPNQLSSRDARVLMGLPTNSDTKERVKLESFFSSTTVDDASKGPAPPRPSREARRASVSQSLMPNIPIDDGLIDWANSHLPSSLQIIDTSGAICGGLTILRLAEAIKGRPSSPPVPDSAFPADPGDDKLDGLFRLFDFLLDNDVKMGSVRHQ